MTAAFLPGFHINELELIDNLKFPLSMWRTQLLPEKVAP